MGKNEKTFKSVNQNAFENLKENATFHLNYCIKTAEKAIQEAEHLSAVAYLDKFAAFINFAYIDNQPVSYCVDLKFAFKQKALEFLQSGSITEKEFVEYLNDAFDIGF